MPEWLLGALVSGAICFAAGIACTLLGVHLTQKKQVKRDQVLDDRADVAARRKSAKEALDELPETMSAVAYKIDRLRGGNQAEDTKAARDQLRRMRNLRAAFASGSLSLEDAERELAEFRDHLASMIQLRDSLVDQ